MKTILFILLLSSFAFISVNAQTTETITELTPIASNIGKFTKNVPKIGYAPYGNNKVKFQVKTEPVILPDGKKAVAVIIQTNIREIIFENIGGNYTAIISFYGRITSKDEKTDGFFEERLTTTAEPEELANGSEKPVTLRKVFELPNGKYQIGIILRDLQAGAHNVKIVKFQIPQTEDSQK